MHKVLVVALTLLMARCSVRDKEKVRRRHEARAIVPEPASVLLVGGGGLVAVWRLRTKR